MVHDLAAKEAPVRNAVLVVNVAAVVVATVVVAAAAEIWEEAAEDLVADVAVRVAPVARRR